jgi:hypothetical protein
MRRKTVGMLLATVLAIAACGGGTKFANNTRPATPINLSVHINDARVLVSPSSVGAGPVSFLVTNQASRTESLRIARSANGAGLATTGPINPQATARVIVNFHLPGQYTVAVASGGHGRTDAQRAFPTPTPTSTRSAALHIGRMRPGSSNALLQP